MATPEDVEQVRRNTNVNEDDATHTFEIIGQYVDALGVSGATAKVWIEKAAGYADLVDVSEAGASEKLGQLKAQAMDMATYWGKVASDETGTTEVKNRAKTHSMTRSRA